MGGATVVTDRVLVPKPTSPFAYIEELTPPRYEHARDASKYAADTEPLGRLLIELGFPLIADNGKHSLVFLIADNVVAKVAKYAADTPGKEHLNAKHIQERNADVAFYNDYPSCFAETSLVFVYDRRFVKYRMYIQELLHEFRPYDINAIQRDANCFMIMSMIVRNRNANLKQWALTRRKCMKTLTVDGVEEEYDREWLVAFDYE